MSIQCIQWAAEFEITFTDPSGPTTIVLRVRNFSPWQALQAACERMVQALPEIAGYDIKIEVTQP